MPVLGVYLANRATRTNQDEVPEESAGEDAWGIDVALEPSEGAEPSEAATNTPPVDGQASESTAGDARALTAAEPSTDDGIRTPRPAAPKRQRSPSVAARTSAPGSAAPLADSATSTSSAPGIGSAERSSLLKDFVWVVSSVNTRDEAWHRLPKGPAGQLRLRLTLNMEGRIVGSSVLGSPPEHLQRLWGRTRLALERGRFAPRPETPTADGHLDLILEARIFDEAAEVTETSDPWSPVAYSQTPPAAGRPGRAYFRFPSGRAVEILVREIAGERAR